MAILSFPMGFNPMIKTHDSNSWQIIHQESPVSTGNIGNIKSPIFFGNIKNPIPIGNIQSPFFVSTILSKSPRLLTLGKEKISWYNHCYGNCLINAWPKIMISCYKPMKCIIIICVTTSTLKVNIQTHKLDI